MGLEFGDLCTGSDIGVAGLNILDLPWDAGIYQNPEEIGRVATLVALSLQLLAAAGDEGASWGSAEHLRKLVAVSETNGTMRGYVESMRLLRC